jgi:autotransporter-associated beta strand protein
MSKLMLASVPRYLTILDMKTRLSRTLRSTARLSLPLTSAIIALLSSHSAIAGNNWDGGGGTGSWNTPANWNLDTLPSTGAPLNFAGNVQNITTNNLAATDLSFAGIGFNSTGIAGSSNAFTLAGNRITLGGNIATAANTAGTTITDTISLDMILDGNRTITTGQQSDAVQHNLTISGIISSSGAFGLTKAGGGTLILSGANTYTGATTVSLGTLTLSGNRTVNTGAYTVSGVGTQTLNIQNGNYGIGGSFIVGNNGGTATVNHSAGTISSVAGGLIMGNGSHGGVRSIYNLSGGSLTTANITMGSNSGVSAASPNTSTINVSGDGALTATTLRIGRYDFAGVFNTISTFTQTAGTTMVTTLGLGGNTANTANSTGPVTANLNLTGGTFSATTIASLSAGGAANASEANKSFINIGGTAQVTLGAFPTARGANSTATITFDTTTGGGGFLAPQVTSATYMPTGTFTSAFLTANGANFNVGTGKDITIGQALENASGAAGTLTKSGVGILTLSGNNTYTGATTLSAGTLSVNTIGNGGVAGNLGAATAEASNLIFAGGGLRYTGATASSDRSFTMNAAVNSINVSTAASTLTLTGSSPTNTGLLQKDGAGGLILNPGEGNGYSLGSINANGGTLTLKSGAFTTTGIDPGQAAYWMGAGARGGTLTVDGAALTVGGDGTRRFVIGAAASGTGNLISGSITAPEVYIGHNGTATMNQSGGTLTTTLLQHVDSGTATYAMTGGNLTVRTIQNNTASANAFTFVMNGGVVRAAADTGTNNLFANAGRGGSEVTVQLGSTGATIDTSLSDARIVRPLDDMPSQAGTLTKIGANTLTLLGNNTYTGATTVSAGTLLVDTGANVSTSASMVNGGLLNVNGAAGSVTVNSGGSLGGSGSVGALSLNSGGLLNPGNSPGTLTANSAIVLGNSTYNWQISNSGVGTTAGTDWDLLNVTTLLDMSAITGTGANKWNLVVTADGAFTGWTNNNSPYEYVFAQAANLSLASGFSTATGTDVTSLFNITASGITSLPNKDFNPSGDFKVVVGRGANDVTTLNLMAVPEPNTRTLLLAGSLVGLMALRRRRA